ncbi:MAG: glycosyltransferase family 2 protein [archaeon]|nr:glycosyltransferase family 2 protein [archaeon]MDA1167512.1 glycosyltransferase family 2 protein [archaeon]
MTQPLVSITVCVRNGAKWVDHCLQSLCQQTYDACEIIVVDDGSTDHTRDELNKWDDPDGVRGPKVKILSQKPLGLSAARQHALEHARGDWVAITDIDVRPEANWISNLMNAYTSTSADEKIVAVTGRTMFGLGPDPVSILRSMEIERKYKSRSRYTSLANGPCSMFLKQALEKVGGFGTNWYHAEDMEVSLLLILEGGKILYASDAVVHHVPETGLKRFLGKRKRDARAHVRIVRKYPRKKRAQNPFDFHGSSMAVLLSTILLLSFILICSLTISTWQSPFKPEFSSEVYWVGLLMLFYEAIMWTGTLGAVHVHSLKNSANFKLIMTIKIRFIIVFWGLALLVGIVQGCIDAVTMKNGHPRLFSKRI